MIHVQYAMPICWIYNATHIHTHIGLIKILNSQHRNRFNKTNKWSKNESAKKNERCTFHTWHATKTTTTTTTSPSEKVSHYFIFVSIVLTTIHNIPQHNTVEIECMHNKRKISSEQDKGIVMKREDEKKDKHNGRIITFCPMQWIDSCHAID